MKKQLQYTTAFVVLLLVILTGTLYLVNTSPFFEGQSNQLTAATTAVAKVDCDMPLREDASVSEKKEYEANCSEE